MTMGTPIYVFVGRDHPSAALAEVSRKLLFPSQRTTGALFQRLFHLCHHPKTYRSLTPDPCPAPTFAVRRTFFQYPCHPKHIARGLVQRLSTTDLYPEGPSALWALKNF